VSQAKLEFLYSVTYRRRNFTLVELMAAYCTTTLLFTVEETGLGAGCTEMSELEQKRLYGFGRR
jgi:hypothetical protein